MGTLGPSNLIQPLNPVFTDGGTNSSTSSSPANQGKDASGVQFQTPEPSPLPPSVEAVSPQGVVVPNNATANPITTQPDPTGAKPPGSGTPPPTSTNPQDGPGTVVPPTTITNPNLPPVDPNGNPTGVTPPPGWKPSGGEGEVSPQDWNDFLRALEEVWKYARTLAQQAEKQQLEQNNSLGTPNELTAKVANQTAFLIDDYARKRLSDTDHKNVQDVLKFVDTWNDPKEKLEFLVNFAGMIMTESNLRGGPMSLDQLAAFARKGSELKKSGGTWKPDERSNVSYDPGDIKQVLKNYVGGAEQYSPEYRARNNRELAINAASFLVPGALGWVGKAFAGAVSGVLARAGRLPSAIRRFEKASEVPFTYGQPENPLAAAETDLFGNIVVRNGIQGDELTSILLHEGVHRMFSPKPGSFLAAFRAEQGLTAYNQLHLVRYIEEAWAETAASGSLRTGLAFPFRYPETYKISPLRLAAEGTGYVRFTIGSSYTAYKWASGGGK